MHDKLLVHSPVNSTDTSAPDDDYFVRFLAYVWRYRIAGLLLFVCITIVAGFVTHQSALPYRTTVSLRLVSPFLTYRNRDYWTTSGKIWRSELDALGGKLSSPDLKIATTVAAEPWLLSVTAEHSANDQIEDVLKQLVNDAARQLAEVNSSAAETDTLVAASAGYSSGMSGILTALRQELSKLEELVPASASVDRTADQLAEAGISSASTSSSVPFQAVPYFPWFQRLQLRACDALSRAAKAEPGRELSADQQREMAHHLEEASSLMTQVWLGLDPSNPVNMIPSATMQSIQSHPNTGRSISRSATIGIWFGAAAVVALSCISMWLCEYWPRISTLSRVGSSSEHSHPVS